MAKEQTHTQVFLCYAREDHTTVKRLYDDLKQAGVSPWMDTEDLLPGQNWKVIIPHALRHSSYVLVFLSSSSISKRGFVQKELKKALDLLDEFSPYDVFVIPVRLEDCEPVDERLQALHWVDLFPSYQEGLSRILQVVTHEGSGETGQEAPGEDCQQEGIAQPHHTSYRESQRDYIEHVGGNVYTGPVTIHQYGPESAAPQKTDQSYLQQTEETQVISLRSEPQPLSKEEARELMEQYRNIQNEFENLGAVIVDHATGLMWQKSGSKKRLPYQQAQEYAKILNQNKFAGYNDWRLPTLPELFSLLEPEEQSNGLHIDPIFDNAQKWCWSVDTSAGSSDLVWDVDFPDGGVYWLGILGYSYVRCVRSMTYNE